MYMKSIKTSNYDYDGDNNFSSCLEYLSKTRHKDICDLSAVKNKIPSFDINVIIEYNNKEMNCLYNIAGYCLKSVQKTCVTCSNCIQSVATKEPSNFLFSRLVRIRCYKQNTLYYVNEPTFKVFLKLENIFRHYSFYFQVMYNVNLHKFLVNEFNSVPADHILNCHNLRQKLYKKFATFRLKIQNKRKKLLPTRKYYDSKSMSMHYSFK